MRLLPAPDGPVPNRPNRTVSSRVVFVGLTCFGLWSLVDAPQLFRNAQASPLGVRRSVAMSVLRPLVRFDQSLGISRLTNAANDVLGRRGTVGGSVTGTGALPANLHKGVRGPQPPNGYVGASPVTIPAASAPADWPPPISQPTTAHALVLLEIGDSLGEDLGFGLADVLPSPQVRLIQAAVGDTGLSRPDYYNWPAQLQEDLDEYHPQGVIVFLGANDAQSFMENGQVVSLGTPLWSADYSARVSAMMEEATQAGAHVLWVGMPIMQSTGLSEDMVVLNSIYSRVSTEYAGVSYFPSWNIFTTASGQYSEFLPGADGSEEAVRDPDGIHLTQSGDDLLARAVIGAMDDDWRLNL